MMSEGRQQQQWSLHALGISPYRGNAYDLRVDLNYRNLQQLPPDLLSLGELQWLNLNVNKLRDLPDGLARLSRLRWLYLENNLFERCPEVVCRLPELTRLYLSCNALTGLPGSMAGLTRLRWLDLSDNRFAEFPSVLCSGSLPGLEKLFLDSNQIASLPAQISSLAGLKLLWLNDNRLEWLPDSLCEMSRLEELHLKNNPLRSLPVSLTRALPGLRSLEWDGCPLIQQLADACGEGLPGLRNHQDRLDAGARERGLVHLRTETGQDGGRQRPCYRMRTRPRGVAIIVDNFCTLEEGDTSGGRASTSSMKDPRLDGSKDADSTDKLRSILVKLGFNVRMMRGLMSLDIISALRFLSLEDHSYFDCLIVCILSRGGRGRVIGPDGIAVEVQQLTDIFSRTNCPTLADKPKLFFLQILEDDPKAKKSPRGETKEPGSAAGTSRSPSMIPDDYDFLLTFALIPEGATSESLPSVYHFYVGVLFDMLETFARKLNLLDLLTTVHAEVRKRRLRGGTSGSPRDRRDRLQISPEIQATLRYHLYLSMASPASGGQASGQSKSVPSSRAATMLE